MGQTLLAGKVAILCTLCTKTAPFVLVDSTNLRLYNRRRTELTPLTRCTAFSDAVTLVPRGVPRRYGDA